MSDAPVTFPWSVIINPDWYDDPADTGFAWSGEASGYEDAVNKALAECWSTNGRDDPAPTYDPRTDYQAGFQVFDADIDFRELAADFIRARRLAQALANANDSGLLQAFPAVRAASNRLDAAFVASGRDA